MLHMTKTNERLSIHAYRLTYTHKYMYSLLETWAIYSESGNEEVHEFRKVKN